jgi:hypothetical protein
MSVIDNYILIVPLIEDGAVDTIRAINMKLADKKKGCFTKVDEHAGGGKVFCADVWMMATNWFLLDEMAALLVGAEWQYPEDIRLIHKGENDESFEMYSLANLRELTKAA